ncbi:uncharacterized protein KNAG_0J01970 [Huiozyma naganishii CBS 8797]|uniref:Uncharacterized protein n=1 Tax=Huiozyma naganishii (strain ATCC MYA-139 / BCRC 22969 / CBS 8797 / KCTC 17520 / NBRC 10181 / NCYC 3082 / Yp74L-3) TaxID=1071383 RepID=J7RR14_HUIN7|nr:hypothetical protein KNAG_0J01970 [Kazachstania naganishii CBS 8797]CCK72278.1 hypothetical protein KNAG_0J01970 [Kazachstania naganishii CBS 8797]
MVREQFLVAATVVFVMLSLLRRSALFQRVVARFIEGTGPKVPGLLKTPGWQVLSSGHRSVGTTELRELQRALAGMARYERAMAKGNAVIVDRTIALPQEQREQLIQVGYFDKIASVNGAILENGSVVWRVLRSALEQLLEVNKEESCRETLIQLCESLGFAVDILPSGGLQLTGESHHRHEDYETLVCSPGARGGDVSPTRVGEALQHLCRDWAPEFQHRESQPLVEYIESQLSPLNLNSHDLVVVPGSGCGYIAYEVAKRHASTPVVSVEQSLLMHLFNEFVFHSGEDVTVRPFASYYSNQWDKNLQMRSVKVPLVRVHRPDNLQCVRGDFNEWVHSTPRQSGRIVVVSAYFLDTAQNVFEYVSSVESLAMACPNTVHWVNVGPLKYGTQPAVQFTAQELSRLLAARGWKETAPPSDDHGDLNGYLTNVESLYQGYYALYKFHKTLTAGSTKQ